MTFQEVLDLINAEIVANGNQEITADVLRPVLVAMLGVPNDAVGDLGYLNTTDISNIVNAINSILSVNIPARTVIYPVSPALVDFDQPDLEWVADAVNNTIALNGSFTVNNGEQIVFSVSALYGAELQTRYYRLITGAAVVNSVGAGDLMPDGIRSTDVDSSLIIDLGDIGAADVWDAFNSDGDQPFSIIGDKFVQAVQGGDSKLWQWIGGDGNFGNSATVALPGWFVLLTDNGVPVSGQTNLSYNDATGEVSNDNGTGFTIPEVSSVNPGLATPDMLEAINGRIVQYGSWESSGFASIWYDYKVLFGDTVVDAIPDVVEYSYCATGYNRYDRVEVDSDGIVSLVTGVESTGFPDKPAPTAGKVTIGFLQISDSAEHWLPVSEGFISKDSQQFQAVYGTGAVTLPITVNFNYALLGGITQVDGIDAVVPSSPEFNRFGQEMKIFNDTGGDVTLKEDILYFQNSGDFTLPNQHVASFFCVPNGGWVFTGSSVQGVTPSGGIASIDGANGVTIDDTDPENPVIGLGDITPTSIDTQGGNGIFGGILSISDDYPSGILSASGDSAYIGDFNGDINNTYVLVDDTNKEVSIKADEVNIDGKLNTTGDVTAGGDVIAVGNLDGAYIFSSGDIDADGRIKGATYGTAEVTDTELGYLDGVTSNIQTQLTNIFSASVFGAAINALTGKTTPVDADGLAIFDSEATNAAKKLTWANLKAALKAYFDPIYIKGNVRMQAASIATMSSSTTYYIGGTANIVPTTASRYKMLFPVNATSFRATLFLYTNGTNYGSGENIQVVLHDVTTNTSHTIGNISITGYSQGLLATVSATITAGNEFDIRLITPSFSTPPQQVVFGGDIDFF